MTGCRSCSPQCASSCITRRTTSLCGRKPRTAVATTASQYLTPTHRNATTALSRTPLGILRSALAWSFRIRSSRRSVSNLSPSGLSDCTLHPSACHKYTEEARVLSSMMIVSGRCGQSTTRKYCLHLGLIKLEMSWIWTLSMEVSRLLWLMIPYGLWMSSRPMVPILLPSFMIVGLLEHTMTGNFNELIFVCRISDYNFNCIWSFQCLSVCFASFGRCEAFSTYPRTYDLLHLDGLFTAEGHRYYRLSSISNFLIAVSVFLIIGVFSSLFA